MKRCLLTVCLLLMTRFARGVTTYETLISIDPFDFLMIGVADVSDGYPYPPGNGTYNCYPVPHAPVMTFDDGTVITGSTSGPDGTVSRSVQFANTPINVSITYHMGVSCRPFQDASWSVSRWARIAHTRVVNVSGAPDHATQRSDGSWYWTWNVHDWVGSPAQRRRDRKRSAKSRLRIAS
jgi:hypothetical protein